MQKSDLMNTTPNFSIIVPVLNEAERINEAVDHIRDQQVDEGVEIIVVDGDRAGSTIKAVTDDEVVKLTAARGRGCQMNRGAAFAKGDVLLFLHVDTRLPPNALALILSALHEKRIVAGAFELGFNTTRKIFTVTEKYVSVRTRLTRVPFGDQAIFIRRDYFEKIGEYAEIPLMEDVELMKRIRKRGDKIAIIPEKVKTLPRRYEQEGILYCTLRNWVLQLFYALGVAPERLAKWYQ